MIPKIELLPEGGKFLITDKNGAVHRGKFTMYALDRFCTSREIPSFLILLQRIVIGMSISDYAYLVLMGLQDYYREDPEQCPWTVESIMDDIFDEMGGIANRSVLGLCKHAIGRITEVKSDPVKESEEEKKSGSRRKKNSSIDLT